MSWRDLENVNKSDCPLCEGAGFYEVIAECTKTKDQHRFLTVKGIRVIGTGLCEVKGYRMLTRCHLCNQALLRGVPQEIMPWLDEQVDNLLSMSGDALF